MSIRFYQEPAKDVDLTDLDNGFDFALGGKTACICDTCRKPFFQYRNSQAQRLCPACMDIKQGRPTVVVNRKLIARFDGVRLESMPSWYWHRFQAAHKDEKRWRIDFSGKEMLPDDPSPGIGKWTGRIVIWSRRAWRPGDIVAMRHMRATHQVAAVYDTDGRRSTVPLSAAADYDAEIEVESREYIALDWTDAAPRHTLSWSETEIGEDPPPSLWEMTCTTLSRIGYLAINR